MVCLLTDVYCIQECQLAIAMEDSTPTSLDDPDRPNRGYEFLDHTADVQIHSWGASLKEAFELSAVGMFAYITDLDLIEEQRTLRIEARGHDLKSALFSFLDEWLYAFSAETFFVPFKVEILEFNRRNDGENGDGNVEIRAIGFGETFDLNKHSQGTEVKAITYSAMQIRETEKAAEVFVIVDI